VSAAARKNLQMRPKNNNCLFWALWKWRKEGGYLCFRKSRHNHFFIRIHVLWHPPEPNEYFEHFIPDKDDLGISPAPLFKGHIKRGDDKRFKMTGH
jgi:hypothetical protein